MTRSSETFTPEQLLALKTLKTQAVQAQHEAQKKAEASVQKRILPHQNPRILEALKWLGETFPLCFQKQTPKPIKVGIFQDIIPHLGENTPSKKSIREALIQYTRNRLYLKSMETCTHRIDLNGCEVEALSSEHTQFSAEKLSQIEARIEAHAAKRRPKKEISVLAPPRP